MRDIFAKAEFVLRWVGEEDEVVEHMYDAPLQVTEDTKDEGDDQSDEGDGLVQIAELPDIIEAFLRRPYFTRSWIAVFSVVLAYTAYTDIISHGIKFSTTYTI
jgi:hypothetical protein